MSNPNEWGLGDTALVLPAAALAGALASVTSGCNLALLGAVAGFAGSRESAGTRAVLAMAACFTAGTVLALSAAGALVGFFGAAAGAFSALWGTLIAGFLCLFFGLAALDLIPFDLPSFRLPSALKPGGAGGSAAFGFAAGAASAACCLGCCAPILPAVLGIAALEGKPGRGALLLSLFGLGYSLPFAAALLGVGIARLTKLAARVDRPLRIAAGILLVASGFWLLATLGHKG